MSSYSFQGLKRVWTPRDEEENRAIFSAMPQDTGIKMPNEFKPVYLENAEFAVEKWTLKQLIRLLRLYGSHRCLWDVRDPDNKNRKLRKAALVDITAAMDDNMTKEQVLQKINVLRGTYRYEKRRIKQRMRKGLGARTKLKWFALADAFLRDVPRAEKLRKEKEDPDTDSDLEDSVVFAIDPEVLIPLEEDDAGTQNQITVDANEQIIPSTAIEDNIEPSYSPETLSPVYDGNTSNEENVYSFLIPSFSNVSEKSQPLTESCQIVTQTLKRRWTAIESVLFVQLLSKEPILWKSDNIDAITSEFSIDCLQALQRIASAMYLPTERLTRRLHVFKKAYTEEKLKILHDASYESDLIWFKLADNFMASQSLQATDFVDTDFLPPQTPSTNQIEGMQVKQEQADYELDAFSPATAINPIPSVAPSHMLENAEIEAMELLFNGEQDGYDLRSDYDLKKLDTVNLDNHTEFPSETNVGTVSPCTKLIWNGLEDDLLEGKWSLKHSVKFLRLYGSHRCLWDLNDPDYRSRVLRNAAIEDIAAAMGYGLDAEYVAKKIKIFRITYMQHRKRMLEACKDGQPEPEIQLRWFPLADSFLRPHIGLRSIKEHEREIPQFDFQYVYANLNLIDPALLTDFEGKGTQNSIKIGSEEVKEVSGEYEEATGSEESRHVF